MLVFKVKKREVGDVIPTLTNFEYIMILLHYNVLIHSFIQPIYEDPLCDRMCFKFWKHSGE